MFMPRFGSDRCTGRGSYYGSIYIPFQFNGDSPPEPDPSEPDKPNNRCVQPKPPPRIQSCCISQSDVAPKLVRLAWLEAKVRVALVVRDRTRSSLAPTVRGYIQASSWRRSMR